VNADLVAHVRAIPDAVDGQIISSAHHNSIKQALLLLIGQLGATGPTSMTIATSVAPTLLADAPNIPWVQSVGLASRPGGVGLVSGWTPVELPDQAHILSLTVLGSRTGTVNELKFDLIRQPVNGTTVTTLISIAGDTTTDPFDKPTNFDTTGVTLAAIEDSTRVDNARYRYMVKAQERNTDVVATIQILGFQVMCTVG
jgi:hypothetical protein